MEVKSVGVWKTMFSNIEKVGTCEEVIYPNSELAMKTIINHKTEFDWNDSVEFDVEHLDKKQIKELKTQIESVRCGGSGGGGDSGGGGGIGYAIYHPRNTLYYYRIHNWWEWLAVLLVALILCTSGCGDGGGVVTAVVVKAVVVEVKVGGYTKYTT